MATVKVCSLHILAHPTAFRIVINLLHIALQQSDKNIMPHSRLAAKICEQHLGFGNKQRIPTAIHSNLPNIFGRDAQIIPATLIFVVYYSKIYLVPINECEMLRC